MVEPIVVKEYSKKILKDCDLETLHNYLECQKLTSALKVTHNGIETSSWVGVIKYKILISKFYQNLFIQKSIKKIMMKKQKRKQNQIFLKIWFLCFLTQKS